MVEKLTLEGLRAQVESGAIDTVLTVFPDMQGRLLGKRFEAHSFLQSGYKETHCCNYLLATDLAMVTPEGFIASSWSKGYGDYKMKPDLDTLRIVPWLEGTAMVICDLFNHDGSEAVAHAPRQMLKRQIERAKAMGFDCVMATELEFFLFQGTHDEIAKNGFTNLNPFSLHNEDYHIFQTTKEEFVMRPIRNSLYQMGIPVEGTRGEAEAGQQELNIRYAAALDCADHHCIAKHAIKEIAYANGVAATFLAKWNESKVGSSSHVHQSLWQNGANVFFDEARPLGKSEIMDHYMAGLIHYAPEYTYFLAPYINSYKRFAKDSFAPTRIVWSVDNRTSAFRLCSADTTSVRVECRIPGSDMNPYLGQAVMIAAGLKGIEDRMVLSAPFSGDAYEDDAILHIPRNLHDARERLLQSTMLREAFGEDVVVHYARAAEVELEQFDRVVTDYEIRRGFEQA